MELHEYQLAATRTAEERAYHWRYLVPGIVGEVGELFGQRAKAHWHGWDDTRLRRELVSEYGDIAWLTAILLTTVEVYDEPQGYAEPIHPFRDVPDPWQQLLNRAHAVHLLAGDWHTRRMVKGDAVLLWAQLRHYSHTITGADFDHVLQANLRKLADRAQRNVLQGSGDHR